MSEFTKLKRNPYKSPVEPPIPTSTLRERMARLAARGLFNAVVVTGFTGIVVIAVWLFRNGYSILVSLCTLAAFMVAALFVGATWRKRTICSMSVPFWAIGGYIGHQSYFALFTYSWFDWVFNDSAMGPIGLMVFLLGFAAAIGAVAYVCLYRLSLWLLPEKKALGTVATR